NCLVVRRLALSTAFSKESLAPLSASSISVSMKSPMKSWPSKSSLKRTNILNSNTKP
ncbi:hypothetical protein LTR14_012258, partial [Exophiala xenobiotica]